MSPELAIITPTSKDPEVRRRTPALNDRAFRVYAPMSDPDVRVPMLISSDIVNARQQGRALAQRVGFSNSNVTIIATAISEISRNIVAYAQDGEVRMTLIEESSRRGVRIVASDNGPGIPDVSVAMRDGYSTGQGLGIGLPGSRRLMDDFEIESTVGKGTTVTMTKWVA
jgi:serine/threonine-protein kinase RsbT